MLYLDSNGLALSSEVGKCDRKDNCNWHYSPSDFFRDRGLRSGSHEGFRPLIKKNSPLLPPSYIEADIMERTLKAYSNNSLMIYLYRVFGKLMEPERITKTAVRCGVGTSKQFGGSPIFWQIDECGRIRTGKIMGYDTTNGKRIKKPFPQLKWIHSMMKESSPNFRLMQSYFGSHKLRMAKIKAEEVYNKSRGMNLQQSAQPMLWLLESEKAALIMSIVLEWLGEDGLVIPLACGGCEGFSINDEKKRNPFDKCSVLKNQRVVLFPDEGKFNSWREQGERLRGFSREVYISTLMESDLREADVGCVIEKGDAIDDVILRLISQGANGDKIADVLLTSYGFRGSYRLA